MEKSTARSTAAGAASSPSPPLQIPERQLREALTPPVLTENISKNNIISPVIFKLKQDACGNNHNNSAQTRNINSHGGGHQNGNNHNSKPGFPAGRYMSPTDSLISPISRGLLARSKRYARPTQAFIPPKILDSTFENSNTGRSCDPK